MQLTEKNLLAFYHYATSLVDAIRPMLNTKNFDNIENPEYWHKSLSEFKTIISNILEDQNESIPLTDEFIKKVHLRLFGEILNAKIQTGLSLTNQTTIILESNQLAKLCMKELLGVEL